MKQEDLMSYIYIGVREQRARELIDELATADHTLEKCKSICEGCDTTDNNAQIFNNTVAGEGGATGGNIHILEVKAKVKTITTTIATTIEQNVKTVVTSTKRMHVGLKFKNVIFAINEVISAKYAREDNKVQHKVQHREDLYQNRNPADLEVNKYMKLKMIIYT